MENMYGIGVKNRYELFYDEDVDPFEIIEQQAVEKEKRKVDKTQSSKEKTKSSTKLGNPLDESGLPKKAKESPIDSSKPTETIALNKPKNRPFTERPVKNVGNFASKEIEERKNFQNREDHFNPDLRERDGEFRRGRGAFRGRGRGAGRARGGFLSNFENRNRREFDRHSGSDKTGVRHIDKREGSGPNNWGDNKSDINRAKAEVRWMEDEFYVSKDKLNESVSSKDISNETEVPVIGEGISDKSLDGTVADGTESKENEPISDERTEESVKEMTLDEWKREQEAKRAVPKYNLRKPGEGEDGNQWKKLYILKKKEEDDDDDEEVEEEYEEEEDDDDDNAKRGRQRQLVDIQINFNDSRRIRGRGRGSRGGIGPRGGGNVGPAGNRDAPLREERSPRDTTSGTHASARSLNRGAGRFKSGQQSAPKVDDWNDFPSLVTA